jgi:hypothetical protein
MEMGTINKSDVFNENNNEKRKDDINMKKEIF